jgi:hypothetical protein
MTNNDSSNEDVFLRYGGFDSKYLGISLHFNQKKQWDYFTSSDDLYHHLIENDDKFRFLCMKSVLGHELRHFHDFFISQYSIKIFRNRINALINGWNVYLDIVKHGNCTIPVPITTWCRLDANARNKQIYLFKQLVKNREEIYDLPFLNNDFLIDSSSYSEVKFDDASNDQFISAVFDAYKKISCYIYDHKTCDYNSFLLPSDIFEFSALACQIAQLRNDYGNEAVSIVLDKLSVINEKPINLFKMFLGIFGDVIDIDLVNMVIFWSLVGNYKHDNILASPENRFFKILEILRDYGLPSKSNDIFCTFNHWSELTHTSFLMDTLNETKKMNDLYCEKIRQIDNQKYTISCIAKNIVSLVEMFSQSSNYMIDSIIKCPADFIFPNRYIMALYNYVNSPVVYNFHTNGIVATEEQFEYKKYSILEATKNDNGVICAQKVSPSIAFSDYNFIDNTIALDISYKLNLNDFFFSPFERNFDLYKPIIETFKQGNIHFMNVIS